MNGIFIPEGTRVILFYPEGDEQPARVERYGGIGEGDAVGYLLAGGLGLARQMAENAALLARLAHETEGEDADG